MGPRQSLAVARGAIEDAAATQAPFPAHNDARPPRGPAFLPGIPMLGKSVRKVLVSAGWEPELSYDFLRFFAFRRSRCAK